MTNQLLTKKFQGMGMSQKIKEISGFKDEDNYENRDLTSNFFFSRFPRLLHFTFFFLTRKVSTGYFRGLNPLPIAK